MANKRMMSLEVTELLAFDMLGEKAQLIYYKMLQYGDDDGFVTNPKRKVKATKKTLKELEDAGFIYNFSSGVSLIRHWFVHNTIRKDMYKETQHLDLKALVILDKSKVYQMNSVTESAQNCTESVPQIRVDQIREDQIRSEQNRKEQNREDQLREGESRSEKENRGQTVTAVTDACGASLSEKEKNFNDFWELYPNKCDRARTREKFMSLSASFEEIMEGLRHHLKCSQWVTDHGYFVPQPYNWLSRKGWLDRPALYIENPPTGAIGGLGEEEKRAIRRALAPEC